MLNKLFYFIYEFYGFYHWFKQRFSLFFVFLFLFHLYFFDYFLIDLLIFFNLSVHIFVGLETFINDYMHNNFKLSSQR